MVKHILSTSTNLWFISTRFQVTELRSRGGEEHPSSLSTHYTFYCSQSVSWSSSPFLFLHSVHFLPFQQLYGYIQIHCFYLPWVSKWLWLTEHSMFFEPSYTCWKSCLTFTQITRSSDGKVVLRNVTEFASGVYKCEITAAVTFRTLAKEVSITISGMFRQSDLIIINFALNLPSQITITQQSIV